MPATSSQPSLFDDPPMPEPYRCDYECGHCLWDGWWQRGTCDGLSIDDGGEEE